MSESEKLRKQGNDDFNSEKCEISFFNALNFYNRALLAIEPDDPHRKESAALCYANRSAVYLELEYFQLCLDNIALAEEHYPEDKIQKLHERRQKCIELMKSKKDKATELLKYQFKLSYPANPKLPYFIDALELKKDSIRDKHQMITTRDLKAGDVIAVMDNCFGIHYTHFTSCENCVNMNNFNLKLYDGCTEALFCSDKCCEEHQKLDHRFHKTLNAVREKIEEKDSDTLSDRMIANALIELTLTAKLFLFYHEAFGSVAEMKKFVEEHRAKDSTIFDFDWSDADETTKTKNMFVSLLNTVDKKNNFDMAERFDGTRKYLEKRLKAHDDDLIKIFSANQRHLKFIDEVLALLFQVALFGQPLRINGVANVRIAKCIDPCKFILNISCDPNISIHTCLGKQIIWVVNRPIESGSEILAAFHTTYYNIEGHSFSCKYESCIACKNHWRSTINMERIAHEVQRRSRIYKISSTGHFLDPNNLMYQFNTLADFINRNFKLKDYLKNPKTREKFAIKMRMMREFIYYICNQRCIIE